MGVALKDITDLLPFIVENLSKCIYIIVVCLIAGFIVGRLLQKSKMKPKMQELTIKLTEKEKKLEILKEEKKDLEEKLDKFSEKYNILQNQMALIHNDRNANSNFSTLNELGRIINSNEGRMEITALIELSLKRDKDVNKASEEENR
jgi:predicted  nucleic acid-binding Zn-ribbon protein